jgi:hypothetical protein
LCDRAVFTHPERERQLPLMSGGPYGIDVSAHLLLERALSAAQIDLICDRCARRCGAQASAPIGGSARVLPDLVHHSASPSIDVVGAA